MPRTIHMAAFFPAPPEKLFDMYLDPKSHAAITGAPVSIGRRPGAPFRAFNGMLTGTILQIVPKRMIVQSWRAKDWKDSDIDSTLILTFYNERRGARIELVHVNVADKDYSGVSEGWSTYYWTPWREYLEKRPAGMKVRSGQGKMK